MYKLIVLFILLIVPSFASQKVRYPAVAGQFYPTSPDTLKQTIDEYLSTAQGKQLPIGPKIMGMIVPHAGYEYSGLTAAYAYQALQGHDFDVIVLLGPYHAAEFPGVAIWDEGTWFSPLGESLIDEDLAHKIQEESPYFSYDYNIHAQEHSLEVQIPFLQVVAPKTKIVPILISDLRFAKSLANALFKHLKGRSALVIASTDLSHYHPDGMARAIDQRTQKVFQSLSPRVFIQAYRQGEIELCGAAAVLTLLELSHLVDRAQFRNLHYDNSSYRTHDSRSVVGYNASLVTVPQGAIPTEQGQILVNLARDALAAYFDGRTKPKFLIRDPILTQKRATFVTLKKQNGDLRGCLGNLEPDTPLYKVVQDLAIKAATQDTRFSPLSRDELSGLSIEISILDKPEKIRNVNDIIYGTHGVIVTQGKRSGIFLPDVSKDFATKEDFLSELCSQKAELPRNCWQNPETQIEVFTTQVFESRG